jgi:hypothetical protein
VKFPDFFKQREIHTKAQNNFFFLLVLKSPPWNLLLANLITATLLLLKFSFSPGVHAVHCFQFQATSTLWSKASNLHYSLMRLPPSPLPPSPAKHTQLSYAGLCHSREGCRAGPGRPSVTDPTRHPARRARSVEIWASGSARTARAKNQKTAMPVPPVQGPDSRSAFCDGPDPTPPRRAGPGRPSVTDPSSVTDVVNLYIRYTWMTKGEELYTSK